MHDPELLTTHPSTRNRKLRELGYNDLQHLDLLPQSGGVTFNSTIAPSGADPVAGHSARAMAAVAGRSGVGELERVLEVAQAVAAALDVEGAVEQAVENGGGQNLVARDRPWRVSSATTRRCATRRAPARPAEHSTNLNRFPDAKGGAIQRSQIHARGKARGHAKDDIGLASIPNLRSSDDKVVPAVTVDVPRARDREAAPASLVDPVEAEAVRAVQGNQVHARGEAGGRPSIDCAR